MDHFDQTTWQANQKSIFRLRWLWMALLQTERHPERKNRKRERAKYDMKVRSPSQGSTITTHLLFSHFLVSAVYGLFLLAVP